MTIKYKNYAMYHMNVGFNCGPKQIYYIRLGYFIIEHVIPFLVGISIVIYKLC